MDTKVMRIDELETDVRGKLQQCYESGQALVVELSNQRFVSVQPLDENDDLIDELIEGNEAFRALLAKSLASPRKPFRPVSNGQ